MIGPVTNVKANLIGGATISFGYLIDYLERSEDSFTLINTQRFPSGRKRILNPFYLFFNVLANIAKTDVIFLNSSRGGTKLLVPLLFIIAKIFKRKFVFRPFGGDIKDYTAGYSKLQKWIFQKTVLRVDILFLQTKELMQFYQDQRANTIHLPTSRDVPPDEMLRGDRSYQKRFIYLGFINREKGIDHLLEASDQLDSNYTIHVYGPIKDNSFRDKFKERPGIYQGILKKEEVLPCLRKYDVLVLPTYYEGEGYPGAVIEAYSLGLPVITTRWKAISEIVEEGQTGVLIDIKSTENLRKSMTFFTKGNYPEFSENARTYFLTHHAADKVTGRAIQEIRNLWTPKEAVVKTK